MITIVAMGVGVLIGWFSKLTITINHDEVAPKVEQKEPVYNESMVDELDPSIRNYYDHSNGLNKF